MWSFLKDHWKTIAIVAASTVVFIAVSVLTAGIAPAVLGVVAGGSAATLVGVAAGGAASGATGYALGQYLDHRRITAKGVVGAALISTVLSVATLGLGARLTPLVTRALTPAVASLPITAAAVNATTRVVTNAAVGSGLGAASQIAQNGLNGRPLLENVKQATAIGGATGVAMTPVQGMLAARALPPEVGPRGSAQAGAGGPPESAFGMTRAIEDLSAGSQSPGGQGGSGATGAAGPAARPGGLTHLTSNEGRSGITAQNELKGNYGIFALDDGVADNAGRASRLARTGIDPKNTESSVRLPGAASKNFKSVLPIGPYSLWKWAGGTRYAPAGKLNMTTGELTVAPGGAQRAFNAIYAFDMIATPALAWAGGTWLKGQGVLSEAGQAAIAPSLPAVPPPAKKPLPGFDD